jgi:hypothetical protein
MHLHYFPPVAARYTALMEVSTTTYEDFTGLPAGIEVALAGYVDRCPRCGRNGIEQRSDDGSRTILHVQASELFGDGMRVEPIDCCSIPPA